MRYGYADVGEERCGLAGLGRCAVWGWVERREGWDQGAHRPGALGVEVVLRCPGFVNEREEDRDECEVEVVVI